MSKNKQLTEEELNKKAVDDAFANYNKNKGQAPDTNSPVATPTIPSNKINVTSNEEFQSKMQQETDPDLMMSYEEVKLPSKGLFYEDGLDSVNIEYLTSKDEDIMTTPSLIENGSVIDVILKKKILNKNIKVENLLSGDKSAIILFLRASSYGHEYEVQVPDPRTNIGFLETVDLRKFKYKEISEKPDSVGEFTVKIPMRDKTIKFRLLTSGEEDAVIKMAENIKDTYQLDYAEYSTMKLKANITEINGNRDRSYIDRFVDVMPAMDAHIIRKRILDVTPEVDMHYEFTAPDGYKFESVLMAGPDFFFPSN